MFIVSRKYTIGTHPWCSSQVESILKKFDIQVEKVKSYTTTLLGHEIVKLYYECLSDEETMDNLIAYFQTNFDGYADITF